jgi:hypothetical protein
VAVVVLLLVQNKLWFAPCLFFFAHPHSPLPYNEVFVTLATPHELRALLAALLTTAAALVAAGAVLTSKVELVIFLSVCDR